MTNTHSLTKNKLIERCSAQKIKKQNYRKIQTENENEKLTQINYVLYNWGKENKNILWIKQKNKKQKQKNNNYKQK